MREADRDRGGAVSARPLVLSLFPGIGMLDMAFDAEGFCTVRGPDVIWGGDIRTWHPVADRFDGIIGGPPCQTFSALANLVRAQGRDVRFGNLIPEFERCVAEAEPAFFLMENVPAAPLPNVPGYGVHSFVMDHCALDGGDGHGLEQERKRRISFGLRDGRVVDLRRWITPAVFLLPAARRHGALSGHGEAPGQRDRTRRNAVLSDRRETPVAIGGSGKLKPSRQPSVTSSEGGRRYTEKRVGEGKALHPMATRAPVVSSAHQVEGRGRRRAGAVSSSDGSTAGMGTMRRYKLAEACRLQGLPEDFLSDSPFTAEGKLKAVANGVPLAMGRAVARAVAEAIGVEVPA